MEPIDFPSEILTDLNVSLVKQLKFIDLTSFGDLNGDLK